MLFSFSQWNRLIYVRAHYPRYYVELSGSFESYLGQFSSKTRATLRRKVKKFQEFSGGTIEWHEYRTVDELEAFHAMAAPLSRRTYQHRLMHSGLPETTEFKSKMRALAARDQVRAYLLFHRGNPVAYLYCPSEENVLIYAYLGYDPEYAEWSCGTVLQYLAFDRLFAEQKFRLFDFTEGEGEHKKLFATGMTACADVLCFRWGVRNVLLVCGHRVLSATSRSAVHMLDRLGIKKRIKKLLRRQ